MSAGKHRTGDSISSKEETDNVTAVELERNRRVLYFSDGTMEEQSDSETNMDEDVTDRNIGVALDEKGMTLGPRLKYKAHKVGSNILAGLDYVGEGLASFLGITTPKYSSEIEHYKRSANKSEDRELEDVDSGEIWQRSDINRNVEVVTNPPQRT